MVYKIVAMEAAEGESELFSLFIFCGVPTLEIIRRKQKTLRYRWSIINNWFIRQLCVHRDVKHLGSLESTKDA